VRRVVTTISCRAFALVTLLVAVCAPGARADDRNPAPKLPLGEWWSVTLDGPVSAGPLSDGTRVYIALASGELTARSATDGKPLWRIKKDLASPMVTGDDLVFVAGGDAVEAIRASDGASAWILPRTTPTAPLLVDGDTLFVVSEPDLVAVRAKTGEVIWRRPAGGVRLAPAIDGDHVYLGADDGRVLALKRGDGAVVWERFFTGGVTAIGAARGLVYLGAGDKFFYCLQGAKKGNNEWEKQIGSLVIGRIVVDDQRVYFAARDNVVRGLDRRNGNQRWNEGMRERPTFGVEVAGHIVFVPAAASELAMLYDQNGEPAGTLVLPGIHPANLVPSIRDVPEGPIIFTVTGGLTNEWHLTKFAPVGDTALLPLSAMVPLPGEPWLTDPALTAIGNVLHELVLGDPMLQPFSAMGWPVVLRDPPLLPLSVLPGLQLRPLSPVLPVRRGGP
jgi:outer membrane protein assembly factor BamB